MTFTVDDNLKVNAIIAASSNSIGADGQILASNGSVIYWTDTAGDVPGANGQILFHYNEQLQANTTLYWHYANNTLEVSGNVVIANIATFNSNKHLILPRGSTLQRDGTLIEGQFRYNTDLNNLEWYNGSGWQQAGTSAGEENQRAFSDVSADTGTAASVLKIDTLTVNGANGVSTSATGKTLNINVQPGHNKLTSNTTGLWIESGNINTSELNNDAPFSTTVGTVTSVGITSGNLIDVSGGPVTGSGNITVNVDLSELTTSTSDNDGDFFAVVDASNVQRKLTKSNINLSGFNNDSSFSSTVGTVTEVTGGNGLTVTNGTTTPDLNIGQGNGIFVTADNINVQVGNNQLIANTTGLWLNAGAVNISEFDNDQGFISNNTVDVLTNKTINGDNNTLSNLDIGIEVDWAAATDVADRTGPFTSGDKLLIQEAGIGLRKIDYDDLPGASGALTATNGAANRVAVFSSSDNVNGDANFTYNGTTLNLAGSTSEAFLNVGSNLTTGTAKLELGLGRSDSGYAFIDLIGDNTDYQDYGLRIVRGNTGANATSELVHRGTGQFVFKAFEASDMLFKTSDTERMRIKSTGEVGIACTSPTVALDVVGTISVNGNIQITNTAVATPYNIGSITDDLTINFNNGNHQYFTFSNTVANKTITLLAPTNTKNGLIGSIRIKKGVSPANATFVFAKEWYFSGGAVPDINGSLTFEQFGYLDYYVHASGQARAAFDGPFANTTNL